jgi:hypothetical protein
MAETDQERERRAIEVAERRAREVAAIEAHLQTHDSQLSTIKDAVNHTAGELRGLAEQVKDLRAEFRQSLAIAADRAITAERTAQKQVTSRELYITAVGVTAAIVSALAAGGVFG